MKYTERWSKSRRKMADGGQVTPGEQATQLAESWRRATQQEPPRFIAEADLPESFRNAQREGIEIGKQLSQQFRQEFSDVDFSNPTSFSKETRQRLQEGQNRYAKLHEERTKEQRAVIEAFTRQNPRVQVVKDVAKARAEYEKNIAKYNEDLAKARQALPQQQATRAAELVSYKIHGSPFTARGTKEQRDRYIDDYNRRQRIAQLKRQKTARSKVT